MAGSPPSTLEEKQRALLQLRLRHKREEALARQSVASAPPEGRDQRTVSPLVPLSPAGTKPPLFLVHAAGGSVAPYAALAALLGDDRPVYALEDPGLHGGTIGERPLAALAATYLAAVREVQPDGPLHVGGWSVGGAVALEMARQDGDVALTFVLDTAIPDGSPSRPGDDELSAWFAADVAAMGAEPGQAELAERFPVFAANVRALLAFRPSRVDSRVVLLHAEGSEPGKLDRWRAYADDIQVVRGDHYTMLQSPHVEALAETMRDRLSEVSVR
ncbi:thioesterase domain-containing protein [Nonomuraea jabiensis]|uniref:Thioesterase domain-containing protein n=1 Tax=Nonomuraea jabiensis TaxID=882448 RepID=A0A7W9LDW9_9ACTN|nr:alpha/beta fold hydrolase [Nonomuraea jabiensis]MBB5780236.1 thioesterase domain-containing protein [Nonomuraea jabiensis]